MFICNFFNKILNYSINLNSKVDYLRQICRKLDFKIKIEQQDLVDLSFVFSIGLFSQLLKFLVKKIYLNLIF